MRTSYYNILLYIEYRKQRKESIMMCEFIGNNYSILLCVHIKKLAKFFIAFRK